MVAYFFEQTGNSTYLTPIASDLCSVVYAGNS